MNSLHEKILQHSAVQSAMTEMKKKLSIRVGHGKTSCGRVSRVRPKNKMEGDGASVEIPIGANEHELIRLGNVR
jgi:hypothetical protein